MTEVTTWQNNDDNVIVQPGVSLELLMTLAKSTVKSIWQSFEDNIMLSLNALQAQPKKVDHPEVPDAPMEGGAVIVVTVLYFTMKCRMLTFTYYFT